MIHQIARTDTDGGTGWLSVPTHVLFDWVLRAGPAAALESAGLADQATRVQNLPCVTESMVARPRQLRPHARLLRETDRAMSALLIEVVSHQSQARDSQQLDLEMPAWRLFMVGASEIHRDYSDAGQHALSTAMWGKERAAFTGELSTFAHRFQRSYDDMLYAAQVWGYNDFLAEISWEPKSADIQAALDHVGLTTVPDGQRRRTTARMR